MVQLVIKFFKNHFSLLLILLVLISYGQILWMQPWQDDNALFFKLAHIEEAAGFIGRGPFGEGVYKYAVTPFIPIYKLFGYFMPAYFGLALIFYIFTTLVIFKSMSIILGEKAGRISGFIFACGYVISDGVWRLANSVTTSISIIIANLFLVCYWKFYKERNIRWYFFALLSYWAGVEFGLSRMHYFIAVVVAFEIIFLAFRKPFIKSIFFSVIRLLPFLILFNSKVVVNDSRISGAGSLVFEILKGKFDSYKGILSSLTNLIIPDWLSGPYAKTVLLAIALLLLGFILFIKLKGNKKRLFLFFSVWIVANLYAYISYLPNTSFGTTDRYLAHSFFALSAIIAILYTGFNKKRILGKTITILIIALGIGNLISNINLQRYILIRRSYPVKEFYNSLKTYLPRVSKGDILYFNVGSSRQQVFTDAISTAMMPNSTSFAWRYNVDRYDFTLSSDFDEVSDLLTNQKTPDIIHSYSFTSNGLTDTTNDIKDYFGNKVNYKGKLEIVSNSSVNLSSLAAGTKWTQPDLKIDLKSSLKSILPLELSLTIEAHPLLTDDVKFPLYASAEKISDNSPWKDEAQRDLSIIYQKEMADFFKNAIFETNNEWQKNVTKNLYDDDPTTFWQSDRVVWQEKQDYIKVKLPSIQNISAVSWMNNTYSGSIPTSDEIYISVDGETWQKVKEISGAKIPTGQQYQLISFSPVRARFVEMKFKDTYGGDSPMVAEFRVIPENLSKLDINAAKEFLERPYLFVNNSNSFKKVFSSLGQIGKAKLYWMNNDEIFWTSNKESELNILFDGKKHVYKINIPSSGDYINKLKISDINIPGNLILYSVSYRGLNFEDFVK